MSDQSQRYGRGYKAVNYAKLDSFGDDSDNDDFKKSSPPNKKQKNQSVGKKEKVPKKQKDENSVLNKDQLPLPAQRKERVSLSDKVLDRDVKAAIVISVSDALPDKQKSQSESKPYSEGKSPQPVEKREATTGLFKNKASGLEINAKGNYQKTEKEVDLSDLENKKQNPAKKKLPALKQIATLVSPVLHKLVSPGMPSKSPLPAKSPLAASGCINVPTTKLKSRNTGLRLGLSRKVPTKPLHTFLKG